MTRKLVTGLALALVLTWGSSAMAQIADGCNLTGTVEPVLTFPYFAGQDERGTGKENPNEWWSGMAIINTTGTPIPAADLCVVGVTNAVPTGINLPRDLGANSMFVDILENIDERFAVPWTALTVFSNNAHAQNLRGFGMVGDSVQGQGYLALRGDHVRGAKELEIPYVPETELDDEQKPKPNAWWKGLAVFNNDAQAQDITFTAYYEDGTTDAWTKQALRANGMIVGLPGTDDFFPDYTVTKRARIVITSQGNIFAFAMFGDGSQAQGLVAPN